MRIKEFNQTVNEMPLPADWDTAQFAPRSTFKNRLSYALAHAAKVGVGSSRVAMTIEYEGRPTVLKVAKNRKGLAQNAAEQGILSDGYVQQLGIAIPIIDYDRANIQPTWIQTELATKASEAQLCAIMGCDKLVTLVGLAFNISGTNRNLPSFTPDAVAQRMRDDNKDEEQIEQLMEWAHNLAVLASGFNLMLADCANPKNWGMYNGQPVLIDLGFSTDVYNTHYDPNRKNKR